jgi:hypothetical protein
VICKALFFRHFGESGGFAVLLNLLLAFFFGHFEYRCDELFCGLVVAIDAIYDVDMVSFYGIE